MDEDRMQWERMLAGEPFDGGLPAFFAARAACAARKVEVDAIPSSDIVARSAALGRLFGRVDGICVVQPPFEVEYGTQVHIGAWAFVNAGALFNDCAPISIGTCAMVGPRVMFLTAGHPVSPEDRQPPSPGLVPPFRVVTTAKAITVEANAWIGAGSIIMPGVTIGEGAVVGAGSVVTRSIPPRTVVAGNPARVLRSVDDLS